MPASAAELRLQRISPLSFDAQNLVKAPPDEAEDAAGSLKGNRRWFVVTSGSKGSLPGSRALMLVLLAILGMYAVVELVIVRPAQAGQNQDSVSGIDPHGSPRAVILDIGMPVFNPINIKRTQTRKGPDPKTREDRPQGGEEGTVEDKPWDTFDEGHQGQHVTSQSVATHRSEPRDRSVQDGHPSVLESSLIIQGASKTVMHHSATIVETDSGDLLAAWFAGLWEARPDVGIWISRYQRGRCGVDQPRCAGQWGQAEELVTPGDGGPTWNPVLCKEPSTGELLLFYKIGPRPQLWKGRLLRSTDNGHTWGEPEALPKGITGPSKNKCLYTEDGTLLAGSSTESGAKGSHPNAKWTSHVEYSHDNGRTWSRTADISYKGKIIQPALVQDSAGAVRMLIRERGPETRDKYKRSNVVLAVSDSTGTSWPNPAVRTNLPCPNTGVDVVSLPDGRLLIAFNDSMRTRYAARTKLALAVSLDNGESWERVLTLEHSPDQVREFSYPSLVVASDGLVHIVYTWSLKEVVPMHAGRENIKHVVLDPTLL